MYRPLKMRFSKNPISAQLYVIVFSTFARNFTPIAMPVSDVFLRVMRENVYIVEIVRKDVARSFRRMAYTFLGLKLVYRHDIKSLVVKRFYTFTRRLEQAV